MKMLKGYVMIRRCAGYSRTVESFEIHTKKPITEELTRIFKEYNITLSEDDTISFKNKREGADTK